MDKFLRADLFAALSEFVSHAHGSFGLQAISSSEPHTVHENKTGCWNTFELYNGDIIFSILLFN